MAVGLQNERRAHPTAPTPGGRRLEDMPEADITVEQVARSFGVNRKTVMKWVGAKTLPALILPNGQYRFERSTILAFRDQLRSTSSLS